jgi:hypothetical protein
MNTAVLLVGVAAASPPPRIGLLLALYNANTTTDWVAVARAAARIPVRAIVPVEGVSPPDPAWAPDYPSAAAYRTGVAMLRKAGVPVYAYAHLRNISRKCCSCCGDLDQLGGWVDRIRAAADFDGVMLDNMDTAWSAHDDRDRDGLARMYAPAAALVRAAGLDVWANGPHVQHDGSAGPPPAVWRPFLSLASFSTLFEMPYTRWLDPAQPIPNYSTALGWPAARLGGYVTDVPPGAAAARPIVEASLKAAAARGLRWLYPTIACKHGVGPHQGSCTYADLPAYWDMLVDVVEELNRPKAHSA